MTVCPVCKGPMLWYENPRRLLCPRAAKHYKYEEGRKIARTVPPGKRRSR